MLFGKKKSYDKQNQIPTVRCSICNGEQVAGFKDAKTGKFHDVMVVHNDRELREFMKMYGVDEVIKEY